MNSLLLLIPLAILLGLLGLAAFLWALRSGQFDDLDGAAQPGADHVAGAMVLRGGGLAWAS